MPRGHAKGKPGWTTYPSETGHTPGDLGSDVLGLWRDIARKNGYIWSICYNIGRDDEIQKRRPEWNRTDGKGKERTAMLCYRNKNSLSLTCSEGEF